MSQTQTQTTEVLSNYTQVDYAQPHWARKKQILAKYPGVKELYAPDPMSAVYATVLSASIVFMAYLLQDQPFWVTFLAAYVVGATIDHALWVLIHDFTHNAAFKDRNLNMIFLLVSNLPHIFPSGVSFRYYHLLHHSFLNETWGDPDLPGPTEAKIFGHSALGKMAWLAFFPFLQTLRTLRFSSGAFSMWMVANWVANISLALCVLKFIGLNGFMFMLIASVFSIGFHPVGGRWIAEHWAVKPPQETYSYYGPLNRVAFNIGYHNEHHDLPEVPWSKLPEVRKRAAEFYDSLYWHDSYLSVLYQFFFSPEFTLTSRVVRKPRKYD